MESTPVIKITNQSTFELSKPLFFNINRDLEVCLRIQHVGQNLSNSIKQFQLNPYEKD